ncbi:hypothetical protein [Parasediminibacterium sp. JCM 36343]|uniref:hypothetical protein n=1 Tax=Parasediminibacterium sp. JCM 36343 TaxID=3374279 RepID=UPI00397BC1DD
MNPGRLIFAGVLVYLLLINLLSNTIMRLICLFTSISIILFFTGCQTNSNTGNTTYETNDTMPEFRSMVKKEPVAVFSKPVKDELNDWKFTVSVFETKQTFKYLLEVKYKENFAKDTISIPNFGTPPTVVLQKGKTDMDCIIGFLDDKKAFREYKLVSCEGLNIKVSTLKNYFIGVYKTKK